MLTKIVTSQRLLAKSLVPITGRSTNVPCLLNKNTPVFYASDFKKKFGKANGGKITVETRTTTTEEVSADFGFGPYMKNVYQATSGGVISSLAIAQFLTTTSFSTSFLLLGGAAIALGGVTSFKRFEHETVAKTVNGNRIPYAQQPFGRTASYGAIFLGTGMVIKPIISLIQATNPVTIPLCIGLTALTFGGASFYARNRSLNSFSQMVAVLTGSVSAIAGLSVASLVSYFVLGANPLVQAMMGLEPFVALGLFSGFLAYNTHQALERYQMGDFDHLSASVQIYLDVVSFVSSFIRKIIRFLRGGN